MQIQVLKSKLHRAQVTAADANYEGSLTIAADLMEQADLLPYERILCGNMTTGARFETYAIPGRPGSGEVVLNGAVARLGQPGDCLTIMSYALVEAADARHWKPRVVVLDKENLMLDRQDP
jgi:aspartate 1-decarboxylase